MTSSAIPYQQSCSENNTENNSVTPIFLNVFQFYIEWGTTDNKELKIFSGADFLYLQKTVIYDWLEIWSREFF